jgi:hypothetical protein
MRVWPLFNRFDEHVLWVSLFVTYLSGELVFIMYERNKKVIYHYQWYVTIIYIHLKLFVFSYMRQNTLSTTLFQKAIAKHKDDKGSVWYIYEWCPSRRICQISPDRDVVFLYRRLHDRTLMPALLSPTGCPTFLSKLCNQLRHYIVWWPEKTALQENKKANYAGEYPPSVPMLSSWSGYVCFLVILLRDFELVSQVTLIN